MRRCMTSAAPSSRRTIRYLPAAVDGLTVRPVEPARPRSAARGASSARRALHALDPSSREPPARAGGERSRPRQLGHRFIIAAIKRGCGSSTPSARAPRADRSDLRRGRRLPRRRPSTSSRRRSSDWERDARAADHERGHRLLVALDDEGRVLGYAKSGLSRARRLRVDLRDLDLRRRASPGRGIGRALYGRLIELLEASSAHDSPSAG